MHSLKQGVSASRMFVAATSLAIGGATMAYGAGGTGNTPVRHIKGRTIISNQLPCATISIRGDLRLIGTQKVNIHGNAEAEQYVFAGFGRDNIVHQFYLIQFEHVLPDNPMAYDYAAMPTTRLGNLQVSYDVKSFTGLGTLLKGDPGSDGAALDHLLESKHLALPINIVMVRMFHLPSADRRTELMIVYGEALPGNTDVPVRDDGVALDTERPALAETFLDHARQGLAVRSE
jgi:hypothetical protein